MCVCLSVCPPPRPLITSGVIWYVGSLHGMTVAVKQLKCYSPHLASCFIKAYECMFHLRHDNIVRVFGICSKVGHVVTEYCHKVIDGYTLRTLGILLLHYGNNLL